MLLSLRDRSMSRHFFPCPYFLFLLMVVEVDCVVMLYFLLCDISICGLILQILADTTGSQSNHFTSLSIGRFIFPDFFKV